MSDLKRFSVSIPGSLEDTNFHVDAFSHEQAEDLYVEAAIDEKISVDIEEMQNAIMLHVTLLSGPGSRPRVVMWEEHHDLNAIRVDSTDAWRRHLAADNGPSI